MTNYEWIKSLSREELAEFLDDRCAETPPDFCTRCKVEEKGEECCNCPITDEKAAWNEWLKREVADDHMDAGDIGQV